MNVDDVIVLIELLPIIPAIDGKRYQIVGENAPL
jgi:hypothetical protein